MLSYAKPPPEEDLYRDPTQESRRPSVLGAGPITVWGVKRVCCLKCVRVGRGGESANLDRAARPLPVPLPRARGGS